MINCDNFVLCQGKDDWKRVDDIHPLDLYFGKDSLGRYAFEYVGKFKINPRVSSSAVILVTQYKNSGSESSIVFSLTDNKWLKQFCTFCNDIIESTSSLPLNSNRGYEETCNRYFLWQKMFKTQTELLSEAEIKGLIGELLVLRNIMFAEYDVDTALASWCGSDKTKKDFSLNDTWYEVKSIDYGKDTVSISSVEQLASALEGELVVVQLEKMSAEYNGISLNRLTQDILRMIPLYSDKEYFIDKLTKVGYRQNPHYDEYVYEFRGLTEYKVTDKFPRLKRDLLPKAVGKARYELILSELVQFIK